MKRDQIKRLLTTAASQYIDKLLDSSPFSDEHLRLIQKSLSDRTLMMEDGCIILPDGRKWSLVTVNREYVAHLGLYLQLCQEFPHALIKLEDSFMDVVIYGADFKIAVEVKKSIRDSARLEEGLKLICQGPDTSAIDRGNDPLRKAKAILSIRPDEFWLASPEATRKFTVQYRETGFELLDKVDGVKSA
ncbi:hypothetical protein K2X05_03585 [bacterium]|nr:hypothetical protein [bacterium]